jgi:hypothetical protein
MKRCSVGPKSMRASLPNGRRPIGFDIPADLSQASDHIAGDAIPQMPFRYAVLILPTDKCHHRAIRRPMPNCPWASLLRKSGPKPNSLKDFLAGHIAGPDRGG